MPAKKYKVTLTDDEKKLLGDRLIKENRTPQSVNGRKRSCLPMKGTPTI